MNWIEFFDPDKALKPIQSFLDTVKSSLESGNWSLLLVLLVIGLFFSLKPSNSGEEKTGGIIYRDLIEIIPLHSRSSFLIWYRVCFWVLELFLVIFTFISLLFSKYISVFLAVFFLIIVVGIFTFFRQKIWRFLDKTRRHPQYRKYRSIFFISLLILGALAWVIRSSTNSPTSLVSSFDANRFSSGESILVKNDPWLRKKDNSENWKDICKKHWSLKEEKRFKEFFEKCPNDSEARIYLNNSEAEIAAKISGNALVRVGVNVPISRDAGQGVYDSLEILRGASLAQQEINEEGGIGFSDRKLFLQINIVDDGNSGIFSERIEAQKAAKFLASKEHITGIIGHFSSDATEAAAEIYRDYGLISISPTSTAVRATGNIWRFLPFKSNELILGSNVFRVAPNDRIAVDKIVEYIHQYNSSYLNNSISSIAVIYEKNSKYGELYKQYFQKAFLDIGGKVLNNEEPNQDECRIDIGAGDTKFKVQNCMEKVANKADALLLVPSTQKSPYLDDVIEKRNTHKERKLHLFGGDSMYKQPFLSKATQGMVVAVPLPKQEFKGLEMNWRAAMSYDATQALAKGVEEASVKCPSKQNPLDKCVRKELQGILSSTNFKAKGILGNEAVKFDDVGDRKISDDLKDKLGALVCVQQQEGQYIFKTLKPRELCL